ncbi:MAG: kinase-like domain-containing protein, partial [Olpidium bornovanus]
MAAPLQSPPTRPPPSGARLQVPTALSGYTVEKKIGKGQFSVVYRARIGKDGPAVALKRVHLYDLVDEKTRSDCLREIDLLTGVGDPHALHPDPASPRHQKTLDHPNVISCLASFVEKNELLIVLEMAEAGDLARLVQDYRNRKQLIPEAAVWNYFEQICRGLKHMHERRIMHRDIKPVRGPRAGTTCGQTDPRGNPALEFCFTSPLTVRRGTFPLFPQPAFPTPTTTPRRLPRNLSSLSGQRVHQCPRRRKAWRPRLGEVVQLDDQGCAFFRWGGGEEGMSSHESHAPTEKAARGVFSFSRVVGTPYYMSPERIHESNYDFKSDIWSLGCVLYELAALRSPFYGEKMTLFSLIQKIELLEYPPLPSDAYSEDVRNCLSP